MGGWVGQAEEPRLPHPRRPGNAKPWPGRACAVLAATSPWQSSLYIPYSPFWHATPTSCTEPTTANKQVMQSTGCCSDCTAQVTPHQTGRGGRQGARKRMGGTGEWHAPGTRKQHCQRALNRWGLEPPGGGGGGGRGLLARTRPQGAGGLQTPKGLYASIYFVGAGDFVFSIRQGGELLFSPHVFILKCSEFQGTSNMHRKRGKQFCPPFASHF